MLRGVNRSIIEISETDNKYFERVLIFVKPEFGTLPMSHLNLEAKKFMSSISFVPMGRNRNSARKRAISRRRRRIILAAVFILALVGIVLKII